MTFNEININENILKGIKEMDIVNPTPIQEKTIPLLLEGKDLIGQAQTGTGKTLAFAIPLLENIKNYKLPSAIILSPTRELAMQIHNEFKKIGKYVPLHYTCVYGGSEITPQIKEIRHGCDILIGTPGRVLDLMRRKVLSLENVQYVILDEADEMLNMGFYEDIVNILQDVNTDHQTALFSATMPEQIKKIAKDFMKEDYQHIKIKTKTETAKNVTQYYVVCNLSDKFEVLCRILDSKDIKNSIIFCKTKRSVDELTEKMQKTGYNVEAIHGDLAQNIRMNTLRKFKDGTVKYLIATDVAARGIDIAGLSHVFNYELPQEHELYLHRIGRTGRAGSHGESYTIITPKETREIHAIEREMKCEIHEIDIPTLSSIHEAQIIQLFKDIDETKQNGHHKQFKSMLLTMDKSELVELSSSLMYIYLHDHQGYHYTKETIKKVKERKPKTITMEMSCGSMDNIKPKDIISFFQDFDIPYKEIRKMKIERKNTYIVTGRKTADLILSQCQKKKIKKRKVMIQLTDKEI